MSGAQQVLLAGSGVSIPALSILSNLASWWTLDENAASPTYNDSHGSNHLTQRNAGGSVNTSVNTTTGGIGSSNRWNGLRTNNLTLYIPRSNTALDMTTHASRTFGGWFHAGQGTDAGTACILMGRVGASFTKMKAYLTVSSANQYQGVYSTDGTTASTIVSDGTIDVSKRALVTLTYNVAGNLLELRVRLFDAVSMTKVTGALVGNIHNGSNDANFTIGENLENDATFNVNVRNGVDKGDECFFTNHALTDTEFDYLFNAGNGKTYADLVADAT